MKKVAILQSNYIPWKGYFDIIRQVDLFVFLDDVQYTTRDWRNRNRIKTPNGNIWVSIPCGASRSRLINEVRVDETPWQKKHYELFEHNYGRAPHWSYVEPFLADIYLDKKWCSLSQLNQYVIRQICSEFLECQTNFTRSETLGSDAVKQQRILDLLEKSGATHYLSGPAAQAYLDQEEFDKRGITLEYMSYDGYPEYPQLHGPFEHGVSILDLLLNTGPDATRYMLPPN